MFFFIFSIFPGDSKSMSAQSTGLVPRFLSRGHTYRSVVGDTLVLPCEVENLGELKGSSFSLITDKQTLNQHSQMLMKHK